MSDIAVLMRTKNSEWVIAQTLSSLFSQEDIDIKLYIVDSGSTDSTLEICDRFPHQKIKMAGESYIPGPVLNSAIEQIPEQIIIMLNSDSVLLHPKSLNYLIRPLLEDKDIVASVGRQIPRHDALPWVRKDYEYCFPDSHQTPEVITLSFPLSAIKREIWEKEKFYQKSWGSEDTEWGRRIIDNNLGSIKYVKDAITMHSHNYTNLELHNRKFIEGEADYFIMSKKPSLLSSIFNYAKRSIGETLYYIRSFNFFSIPAIYFRNIYYFLGYYRGLKSAQKRQRNNINEVVHKQY